MLMQHGRHWHVMRVSFQFCGNGFHFITCSPVAPSDLSTKGAAVLIEVYDYELLGSNDVIGVALLDLSDVPTVSSTRDSGLADTQEHHVATLPLFIPVDSPALRELANRAMGKKDLAAHELVQKIRKLRSL